MRKGAVLALLMSTAVLAACTRTVLEPVPPRVDLRSYGTLGIVEFASNASPAIDAKATRDFQARIHSAQPGTPLKELGSREAVLAAVGARQFDAEALTRIGAKYRVDAIFIGEIAYSDPETRVKINDIIRLKGSASTVIRGDITCKLVETRAGASVWSAGAWATRRIGRVSVSAERGVSGAAESGDPRAEMLSAMLGHLTDDFRPGTVRRRAD